MKDDGTVDVVGSQILVGITVVAFSLLALLTSNLPGPVDGTNADLALDVDPGVAGWGTGDETLRIRHMGGEPFRTGTFRVDLSLDGTAQVPVFNSPDAADGRLSAGETWVIRTTLPAGTAVHFAIVDLTADRLVSVLDTVAGGA